MICPFNIPQGKLLQGSERTADYGKLLDYGLDSKVADKLDDIYKVIRPFLLKPIYLT